MAEFPTYEQMAKNVAEKALDEFLYDGKSIREWIKIIAEQEQKWISVSERLPESAGVYIVTREFTDGFECADLADACYFDGTSTWHDDNRINHGREYVDKKIKAWMPLPEPYEPQESKKVNCKSTKCDNCINHNYCDFEP